MERCAVGELHRKPPISSWYRDNIIGFLKKHNIIFIIKRDFFPANINLALIYRVNYNIKLYRNLIRIFILVLAVTLDDIPTTGELGDKGGLVTRDGATRLTIALRMHSGATGTRLLLGTFRRHQAVRRDEQPTPKQAFRYYGQGRRACFRLCLAISKRSVRRRWVQCVMSSLRVFPGACDGSSTSGYRLAWS